MKTASLIALFVTAAAAADSVQDELNTVWKDGVYNVSGSVTIPGYKVDSSDGASADWTWEQRLHVDANKTAWTYSGLRDTSGSFDGGKVVDGWTMCEQIMRVVRNGTDPIDPECKGVLSDECLKELKESIRMSPDGNHTCASKTPCSADFSSSRCKSH